MRCTRHGQHAVPAHTQRGGGGEAAGYPPLGWQPKVAGAACPRPYPAAPCHWQAVEWCATSMGSLWERMRDGMSVARVCCEGMNARFILQAAELSLHTQQLGQHCAAAAATCAPAPEPRPFAQRQCTVQSRLFALSPVSEPIIARSNPVVIPTTRLGEHLLHTVHAHTPQQPEPASYRRLHKTHAPARPLESRAALLLLLLLPALTPRPSRRTAGTAGCGP